MTSVAIVRTTADEQSLWQSTVDAVDAAVLLLDSTGRIVRANEKARELSGLTTLIGQPIGILGTGEMWLTAAELAQAVTTKAPSASRQVQDRFSSTTWDVNARRIPDGSVIVLRDITNFLALETNARQNELVAEMGRLVGNVAHEVRNPLFSMSATVDALEARLAAGEPIVRRYVDNLRRELRRITALMQDLLEYGKPPLLDAAIQPLREAITDAAAVAQSAAAARGVSIDMTGVDDQATVLIDRTRIAQAFQNVLENAIQFAPDGSAIRVRTERIVNGDGRPWVSCLIDDAGPGFPDDLIGSVFEPFFTTRAGGTGLGLSIVRRIIDIHGGRAFAANRPEGGARVSLWFPLREHP